LASYVFLYQYRNISASEKRHRGCTVLAVDAALPVLLKHKIQPDFIIAVESQLAIEKAYIGANRTKSTIISDLASRPAVLRHTRGRHLYFYSEFSESEFLKNAYEEQTGNHIDYFKFISEVNKSLDDLNFSRDMIHRDVNAGFSGGEKKKNEVLQIKILKPKLIILDEIDSGLDVDSLKVVCENINEYKNEFPDTSILIITHYPRILEAIKPDYVHIMKNGKIVKTGDMSLALETEQVGYNE